jgi:hypothetical protein
MSLYRSWVKPSNYGRIVGPTISSLPTEPFANLLGSDPLTRFRTLARQSRPQLVDDIWENTINGYRNSPVRLSVKWLVSTLCQAL